MSDLWSGQLTPVTDLRSLLLGQITSSSGICQMASSFRTFLVTMLSSTLSWSIPMVSSCLEVPTAPPHVLTLFSQRITVASPSSITRQATSSKKWRPFPNQVPLTANPGFLRWRTIAVGVVSSLRRRTRLSKSIRKTLVRCVVLHSLMCALLIVCLD